MIDALSTLASLFPLINKHGVVIKMVDETTFLTCDLAPKDENTLLDTIETKEIKIDPSRNVAIVSPFKYSGRCSGLSGRFR